MAAGESTPLSTSIASLLALPDRFRRRVAAERAQRGLEQEFAALMATRPRVQAIAQPTAGGPRVGFATFGSGTWHFVLEALLAHALALRGASPELLMCDLPGLPVCDERTSLLRDPRTCHGCLPEKRALLGLCQIPWRGLSEFVNHGSLERARRVVGELSDDELEDYAEGPWALGRWTFVSACHFLRADARGKGPETIAVKRLFLTTAIVVREAVERWLDEIRPDIVIAESGGHFMWRIAFELARARGIRVVCREIGKGGWDQHIYSLNAECMFPDLTDTWAEVKQVGLSPDQIDRALAYLRDLPARTYAAPGGQVREAAPDRLRRELGLDRGRKTLVLFTGVTWDLATAGRDAGFDGMYDWIDETIRITASSPDLRLVIRVHPAEASIATRERALDRISARWPVLPPNVTTIAPDDGIAVRSLCDVADLVLVYCSTTGMEAAVYGKPVVVCGAPHYRGRGFTLDMRSREEYRSMLQAMGRGDLKHAREEAADAALRYVHLFYFRYHIGMKWTTSPIEPPWRLTIGDLSELLPGRSRSVDAVCSGVLEGREILLPASPQRGPLS